MDDYVLKNLNELKIPEDIVQEFTNQRVDEEAFLRLSESMVRELCLPVGHHSKIFKRINELKSKLSSNAQISLDSTMDTPVFNIFANGNLRDVDDLLNSWESFDAESCINIANQEYAETGRNLSTSPTEIHHCTNLINNEPNTSSNVIDFTKFINTEIISFPKTSYTDTPSNTPIDTTISTINNIDINHKQNTINSTTLDASINLKDILNSYHDGQMLLKTYESSNKLNGLLRNVSKRSHTRTKKNLIRPSKLEIQQSFIYYVNNVSQLKEVDNEKANKALRTGERLQPYMVFVETDNRVTYFYVVINKFYYKVESALKAIDILCFKSFFVFNLNYPIQCEQIWYFIQIFFLTLLQNLTKNFRMLAS